MQIQTAGIYNLNLSQNRAFSVASYCMDNQNHLLAPERLEDLRKVLTANGRSWSNPIEKNGVEDKQASRRVKNQISFE